MKCSWEEKLTPLLLGAFLAVLLGGIINSTPAGSSYWSAPGRSNSLIPLLLLTVIELLLGGVVGPFPFWEQSSAAY